MEKKKFFDNPLFRTKITSANVKPKEMLLGYFIAPFCALMDRQIKVRSILSHPSNDFCNLCDYRKSSGRTSNG